MPDKTLFGEPMRLSCLCCDREDADGVYEIPEGWTGVAEELDGRFDWQWWTHQGVCPECQLHTTEKANQMCDCAPNNNPPAGNK